jgi:hypothetical protein
MSILDIVGIDWGADRLLPAFQTPQHLTVFDLRGASNETQLSVATMAGLVNRPVPRVYLIWNDEDAFWQKELLGGVSQENSPASGDGALEGMLISFRDAVQGVVIYDPNFPDSVNIATTLAGQYACVVVSPDQAASLQQLFNLPVHTDLRSQHWSNRSEAYDWARQNLLAGASAHAVAGLNPTIAGLRSFLVANRIFTYWLDSSSGEQGLMAQIFEAFAPGAVHLGWFVDEPSGVKLTSNAAISVLATDLSTNLEVWTGVPNATSFAQSNPAEPIGSIDASKVYLSFTISDGDNLQYNQRRLKDLWQDAARGSFPLGWTISPVLSQAAPAMAAYYARTATAHDELIAGPSGAGYMYPSQWPQQQLAAFLQRTVQLVRSMNLTTLEVLDIGNDDSAGTSILDLLRQAVSSLLGLTSGASILDMLQEVLPVLESEIPGLRGSQLFSSAALQTQFTQALAPAGVNGILSGAGVKVPGLAYSSGDVPVYYNLGLADSVQSTVNLVKSASLLLKQRPLFLNVYLLAWKMGPSDIKQAIQQLGGVYVVVKPGTLLRMIKQVHAKGS